ncbi:zinc finger protein 43-like [Bradysia coprophila]|uniref:zinc finger protein 43-like n=1 Tax=Bradysia coprophila TaxID=38358 RepID=UPI00187D89B0|nr:zinc finger protein 43-like [Bradysia coprophila]
MDMDMEDVKPSFSTSHIFDALDTESETLPMKMGEIFRNNKEQYSFMCYSCGLVFEDFGEIINHCEGHYPDEKYDVTVRPSEFVCAEIESEIAVFNSNASLPDLTLTEPTESAGLIEHSSDALQPQKRKRKRKQTDVKYLKPDIPQNCPICEEWCDDYRNHIRNVHNFNYTVFQCYMCKKFFKSSTRLSSHMSAWNHTTNHCYHCEMEPPIKHPSEPRRHKCQFCKEWFLNHVEFKAHFKDAHNEDADFFFHKRKNCNCFTCYICEREFPLRYYLVAHMRTHYDKFLRHQCPTCGRRLRTYGQLTQHLKTHEGKTFACDQCDKQFPYYAKLRLHRASHITELNFMCDECPKAFKKRSYLKRHKAVHTNERRYRCKFCESSFNFTSARRAHEKSQHGAL